MVSDLHKPNRIIGLTQLRWNIITFLSKTYKKVAYQKIETNSKAAKIQREDFVLQIIPYI